MEALNYLYSSFFPKIHAMIRGLGGQESDANDIFQEAIIIFYRKAKKKEVDETTAVLPYLMLTCKHIWLKFYRDEKNIWESYPENISNENNLIQEYIDSKKKALMYKHFRMLAAECRRVIKAFYKGMNYREIAEKYGYSSEDYARRKKYICKDILVQSIKSDPDFNEIFDGNESDLQQ